MIELKVGDKLIVTKADGSSHVGDTMKVTKVCDNGGDAYVTFLPGSNNTSSAWIISKDNDRDCWGSNCSDGAVDFLKKKVVKPKKINFKNLDKVVVTPEIREEVEAVLKQHQNKDKMFVDWGLESIGYGKGMTFLFYGGPGTGKTWMANCISETMGMEMLCVGMAEIQTSEPGGANRAIQAAFKECKDKGKILFLDECDSLVTSRSGMGMILAGEVNTLLTEIEKCEGIVVLATNRIENLDEALERRISLIVEFPEPSFEQRREIWYKTIPKKMPLKDVDLDSLSEHKLTGGQIKNVVLQAARLALGEDASVVEMRHFESAIKRVNKSKNLLGTASRYEQVSMRRGDIADTGVGKKIVRSKVNADSNR